MDSSLHINPVLPAREGRGDIRKQVNNQSELRYLGHVTGYQPIRDQYFLIRSVLSVNYLADSLAWRIDGHKQVRRKVIPQNKQRIEGNWKWETSKQPIRTRYLGHVTGYQPIRDQYFLGLTLIK
eukprot:sb/3475792/